MMDVIFREGWRQRAREYEPDSWWYLIRMLVASLQRTTGWNLQLDDRSSHCVGDGFSVDLRGLNVTSGPLDLRMRAILGGDVIEDRLLVRAFVFLYSGSCRLDGAGEYLELQATPADGNPWVAVGWMHGEPGEFDTFLRY